MVTLTTLLLEILTVDLLHLKLSSHINDAKFGGNSWSMQQLPGFEVIAGSGCLSTLPFQLCALSKFLKMFPNYNAVTKAVFYSHLGFWQLFILDPAGTEYRHSSRSITHLYVHVEMSWTSMSVK